MNKPNTPLPYLRDWPEDEPDPDLSNLGPDDAPELTEELAAQFRPLEEVDPELAEFFRKGGRLALPARYREPISVPLDKDIAEHFKVGEEGWVDRINAALRKAAGFDPR